MSKIELAMEKAARMRQEKQAAEVQQPGPPVPTVSTVPPMPSQQVKLSPSNPSLVVMHDPHSPTAEEYRKLKSALVEITRAQKNLFRNTVLVTSAVPKEGKSITALNLAISLAQELDETVLLVDADLRNPALHRYLEIDQGVGLADVLLGEAQIGEAIIATGIGKLSIMRAGVAIDNPAELFLSAKMKGVVDELKNRYPDRYLIFDTPPMLPFAETKSLAHLVDGVLFVVKERLASQASIKEAIESLEGLNLLGVIYNAAILDCTDERYSYYRSYERNKLGPGSQS